MALVIHKKCFREGTVLTSVHVYNLTNGKSLMSTVDKYETNANILMPSHVNVRDERGYQYLPDIPILEVEFLVRGHPLPDALDIGVTRPQPEHRRVPRGCVCRGRRSQCSGIYASTHSNWQTEGVSTDKL